MPLPQVQTTNSFNDWRLITNQIASAVDSNSASINGTLTPVSLNTSGSASIGTNLVVNGNLSVSGTFTTVNTANFVVAGKLLTVGNVVTPTDITAAGGGLDLKGTTDKTLIWNSAANGWESSESIQIASGKTFRIAGSDILSSTTIGSSVVNSSLTSVGTLSSGTWNAGVIAGQYGGTGVANIGKTITLGGNLSTSGAFPLALNLTASSNLTLPVSGTLATLSNTETITNKSISLGSNTLTGTSAQLATAISDETGSGSLVFAANPILVTPNIGTPTAGTLTNCTGLPYSGLTGTVPTWNQNTTGTAATATNALSLGGSLAANYAQLSNATYIGTTSIALNRTSLAQTLTGVSIDGNSATTTLAANSSQLGGVAAASYALTSSLSSYATLASPALSGTPTTPTATAGTNTTQIASTAFVQTAASSAVASYAPLASPPLTGTPTINGSAAQALSNFTGGSQLLAANGFQRLPGGLLIQWGTIASMSPGNNSVTFSTAFANVVYVNFSIAANNGSANAALTVPTITTTGCTLNNSSGVTTRCQWIAVGY